MSYDEDFASFVEMARADMECRIWKSECAVAEAELRSARLHLYLDRYPDSTFAGRMAKLQEMAQERFVTVPPPLGPDRAPKNHVAVEGAAYGWRRDYGEWPSWFNLVDRLSEELRIYRSAAERRIANAVNCTSDGAYVYAIGDEDLQIVLADEEPLASAPLPQPIRGFRFYVTAEGIAAHSLEQRYDDWSLIQRCRQAA